MLRVGVGGHLSSGNGRFCRLLAGTAWFSQWNPGVAQVAGRCVAVNPGIAFDSAQWPAEAAQRDYLVLLFFVQDIAHEN